MKRTFIPLRSYYERARELALMLGAASLLQIILSL